MTPRSDVIIGSDWLVLSVSIKIIVLCGFAWSSTEPLATAGEGGGRGGGGGGGSFPLLTPAPPPLLRQPSQRI
jgi:hypothetical protein